MATSCSPTGRRPELIQGACCVERARRGETAHMTHVRSMLLALLVVSAQRVDGQTQAATPVSDPASRIDGFVQSEMLRQGIPGVAVGIVNKGHVTTKGYGKANVELDVPVTDRTIFQSG